MKTKRKAARATGANADGGTIEKGQSRSAHAKADSSSTGKTGKAEWLDETERDTPDRKKIRDKLTNAPAKSRTARKQ